MEKRLTIRCLKCRVEALDQPITPHSAYVATWAFQCQTCDTRNVSVIKPDWTHLEFPDLSTDNGKIVRVPPRKNEHKPTPPSPKLRPPTQASRVLNSAGAI